jgi:hypothetical protein
MKRALIAGLSVMMLSSLAIFPVNAESSVTQNPNSSQTEATGNASYQISPRDLVVQAHRGTFSSQGIPGYSQLRNAYNAGKVSAESLVKTAIDAGRLAPEVSSDKGYIRAVDVQLKNMMGG